MFTTRLDIFENWILPTQCIYVFVIILGRTAIISLIRINLVIFKKGRQCVYCVVGTPIFYQLQSFKVLSLSVNMEHHADI
jgi:hypothetical protein